MKLDLLSRLAQASSYDQVLRYQGAITFIDQLTMGHLASEAMAPYLPDPTLDPIGYMSDDATDAQETHDA